ncbi:MAG: glucosamine-6-phosphate deaminase [Chloroflexota bacterium]|nr:glucosamine-6-phosphate deaminase [Chloroflexota bacterium]
MPHPEEVRVFKADKLQARVYATRDAMGAAAADAVVHRIEQLLAEKEQVRIVFAAAVSQNEFLAHLRQAEGVEWDRIEAFHMDEYVGLPDDASQRFGNFLKEHLFDRVQPGHVEYIDGTAPDLKAECARYAALLAERPLDIVCAGIGENGHMAFNDPHVANFHDPEMVKVVALDRTCRMQQVHDGAFAALDQVPTHALTLTMPALMSARWIYCMVPGATKREAVRETIKGPISTACPATAMRRHDHAILYLDAEAARDV